MPEKLKLTDGTELTGNAIKSGDLFLYIYGLEIQEVFAMLIDREKVRRVIFIQNDGTETAFNGYIRLIAVRDEGDGLITAVLRKEEARYV